MENMENAARKKVMLSGIQPSGDLTLGSYLGAIKNWAERDEEFDNYYFMADMHSITVRQDPAALRRRTLNEISLPAGTLIISIVRGDALIIPNGSTMMQPRDEVVAVCAAGSQKELLRILSGRA